MILRFPCYKKYRLHYCMRYFLYLFCHVSAGDYRIGDDVCVLNALFFAHAFDHNADHGLCSAPAEEGRYCGADSLFGSIDATHISSSSEGLNAVSSLFENACDDATNQRGYSSSLHKVIDNHDGTYSLQYKNFMAWVYYWGNRRVGDTTTPRFGV